MMRIWVPFSSRCVAKEWRRVWTVTRLRKSRAPPTQSRIALRRRPFSGTGFNLASAASFNHRRRHLSHHDRPRNRLAGQRSLRHDPPPSPACRRDEEPPPRVVEDFLARRRHLDDGGPVSTPFRGYCVSVPVAGLQSRQGWLAERAVRRRPRRPRHRRARPPPDDAPFYGLVGGR